VKLDRTQLEQYQRDGYTTHAGFLDQEKVSQYLLEVEQICADQTFGRHDAAVVEMEPDQRPDGRRVRRVHDPCSQYSTFIALAEATGLLDGVEQLIGPNIYFIGSKINVKPPEIGSVVEWHQDFAYGPATNTDLVSVLVYLDDADAENGCLQVLPGYHRGRLLDHTQEGYFQGQITEEFDASGAVDLAGKCGTAIFLHCMTPHASRPNRAQKWRRTLILSYRATDAIPVYSGEMTRKGDTYLRLVRGQDSHVARFTLQEIAIPHYASGTASLYQLQEDFCKKRGVA